MVTNSIFDSQINAAGGSIGPVLALVVLFLIARAAHHMFVKRPRSVIKRDYSKHTDKHIVGTESALQRQQGLYFFTAY